MTFLPLILKLFKFLLVFCLTIQGFIMFFKFGDTSVFVHHLLVVTSTLRWRTRSQELSEGFEYFTDSK